MLETKSKNLKEKTVRGIFWSYLAFVSGKGMTFIATIILARLLLPEDFGLMGFGLIAIQYMDILNAAGIGAALIARQEKVEEAANAAFVVNIVLGLVTFGLTWVFAPVVADFFNEPDVVPLLRVLALTLPISSLGTVPNVMIQRELRFKLKLVPDISRNIAKGLLSIILAFLGYGVWSLVIGQIAGVFVGAILSWVLAGWRPTWKFDRQSTRAMLIFGGNILLLDLLSAFSSNVDYLLIGKLLGAAALGYYTMAFRIPDLIISGINNAVGVVAFPALASAQNDPAKLKSFYFGYVRYLAAVVFPIGVGLSLTAPLFVPIFFSEKWLPTIAPTVLISLGMAIMALGYVPGVLYKATNRPEILNYLTLIELPIAVAVLWYATRWGITGVAAAQVLIYTMILLLNTYAANFIMKYTLKDVFNAVRSSLLATALMAAVVGSIYWWLSAQGFLGLMGMAGAGVITYLAALYLLDRALLHGGRDLIRRAFTERSTGLVENADGQL